MIKVVNSSWFAVYVRSRAEKKVALELEKQHIEFYLPLYKTIRQWSDRKKKVELPLIRSYVFVRINKKQHLSVLQTPGVVRFVCFSGVPVPVPSWQIENLKILLGSEVPFTTEIHEFKTGEEVTLSRGAGPLEGLRGRVLQIRGRHKLVISISALNYNLTIDIDPKRAEKLTPA